MSMLDSYVVAHLPSEEKRFAVPLVRKSDAEEALAALQARLDTAERSKATLLESLREMVAECGGQGPVTKRARAAIDAASQEKQG